MADGRRYADYLSGGGEPEDKGDLKQPSGPRPTRAWVQPEHEVAEAEIFRCLVEEFPVDHFNRTGSFDEILRWAVVDHAAKDIYLWNDERRDWDRPSRAEVMRMIGSS